MHIHIIIERAEEKPWPWLEGSGPGGEEVEVGALIQAAQEAVLLKLQANSQGTKHNIKVRIIRQAVRFAEKTSQNTVSADLL